MTKPSEGFMGSVAEKVQARVDLPGKLEPSGDAEHDSLTDQVHNLDALSPLRNSVIREDYEQTVADAEEDAAEDEEQD